MYSAGYFAQQGTGNKLDCTVLGPCRTIMEGFNAACLAAKSANALPWETESDPPVCASHFTTDNSDGNIIDSSKCFTIAQC